MLNFQLLANSMLYYSCVRCIQVQISYLNRMDYFVNLLPAMLYFFFVLWKSVRKWMCFFVCRWLKYANTVARMLCGVHKRTKMSVFGECIKSVCVCGCVCACSACQCVCVCIYVCACECVCFSVCMYTCMDGFMDRCLTPCECVCVLMCFRVYGCVCVCILVLLMGYHLCVSCVCIIPDTSCLFCFVSLGARPRQKQHPEMSQRKKSQALKGQKVLKIPQMPKFQKAQKSKNAMTFERYTKTGWVSRTP